MTESAHEWNSQVYHKVSNPQFEWGLKVLDRLQLAGDERVMDAGCGSGRLTAKLLDRLPRGEVVGVDLSQNMLTEAAANLTGYGNRVSFVRADLANLPFAAEFDVVFSTASFHWVPDHDALFGSLAMALKSGGRIEAQCGGGANLHDVHRRIMNLMHSERYSRFFGNWKYPWEFASAETTAKRMTRAGFVNIETWLEPAAFRLGSAEEYREFLPTVILRPFLQAITDERLRNEFVEDMVRQAVEDPAFQLDYWRLNLRGRKADSATRSGPTV
ncbi:MAG TPA: methyltransferase domain-containing protein [Terriglobales bacterium]|nr:methyltransferase domain-containing protein [Terriglobales bacterium]